MQKYNIAEVDLEILRSWNLNSFAHVKYKSSQRGDQNYTNSRVRGNLQK